MVKIIAVMALMSTVSADFEVDAARISVMRVLVQEKENLLGKILEEKVVAYGASVYKDGKPYFYVTSEKTVLVKIPGGPSEVRFRETTIIDQEKTVCLTQNIGYHDSVDLIRSLTIIKSEGDHTSVSLKTVARIDGVRQLWTNVGIRIKNRKIEEALRLHLE